MRNKLLMLLVFFGTSMLFGQDCTTYRNLKNGYTKEAIKLNTKICLYKKDRVFTIDDVQFKVIEASEYTDKIIFIVIDKDLEESVLALYKDNSMAIFNEKLKLYYIFY